MSELREIVLYDKEGKPYEVQNPIPCDGDSVYTKDLDLDRSDNGGFVPLPGREGSGTVEDYFNSLTTVNCNSTGDNPKVINVQFKRTIQTNRIGFGCDDLSKGFGSSITVKIIGSGDQVRTIAGPVAVTNPNSFVIDFEPQSANGIIIEFNDSGEVCLSNLIIYKSVNVNSRLQGTDPSGNLKDVNTNIIGNLLVSLDEQKDAFGRLKTADPFTIWDNSLTTGLSDTLFWSEILNGGGSSAYDRFTSKKTISTAGPGDYVVRQTKQRFKYQPAKSHEFFITGLFNTESGQRKRAGLVDYDNPGIGTPTNVPQNGVFFENNDGVLSWNIVSNGVVTETADQSQWNIDALDGNGRSRATLNIDAVNILTGQLEWLGVGVVLVGFATGGGEVLYCHAFQHASVAGFEDVYMRTANLPIAYELTSSAGAGSMKCICSSVISGGGFNPQGITGAAQNTNDVSVGNDQTVGLIGIRLQSDFFEYEIDPTQLSILSTSNGNTLWALAINPEYNGSPTWANLPNSVLQVAENSGDITDIGQVIARGSFANNQDSVNSDIETALRIGKDLAGERDELWLIVTALGNESYYGTINFRELI